jgi:NADH-quinone oxidoreductase subunit J
VILFFFLAILMIASALTVILHRRPVYSALALVNTLFLIAVMFLLLNAELIALLQVIVYAGAIMVLFLFVIMLLSLSGEESGGGRLGVRGLAALSGLLLTIELGAVSAAGARVSTTQIAGSYGSTETLAERLFTRHLLPFELTSVLLLVAIVGAVVMARRKA